MNLLKPHTLPDSQSSQINVKIWEVLNNTLTMVGSCISIGWLEINWLENFDKNKTYLIVSNHPSYIDWFYLRKVFSDLWIKVSFVLHNNILETKFLWDYLKWQWHIGVLKKRDFHYYSQRWLSEDEAIKMVTKRGEKASTVNKNAYKSSIETLSDWTSLLIFASGWGYKNLWENSEVYNWYKKIISLYLSKNTSLEVLPVTLVFSSGYKRWGFPIRSKLQVNINQSMLVTSENKEDISREIDLILS